MKLFVVCGRSHSGIDHAKAYLSRHKEACSIINFADASANPEKVSVMFATLYAAEHLRKYGIESKVLFIDTNKYVVLSEAIARGRIHAPGFFLDPVIRMAYCGAQWNGPAQGMVDPVKEVSAAEKRIEIGISTRQRETTELLGGDFESNVAQLARENQMMKDAGLSSGATSSGGADAGKENIKESEEETDAEGTESDGDGGES